jgi:3-deoxy-D-manno-octulosonic-acid transferase
MDMSFLLYNALATIAAPVGAGWLAARPDRRPLLRRFAPLSAPLAGNPLWLQACSVGELMAIKPLLAGLQRRWPQVPLLLTTSTLSGFRWAETASLPATLAFFPFDHPLAVERFLNRAAPRALVLLETEIWPNVVRRAARRGTPVLLLSARLSDKHFPRYRRLRPLLQPVFASISAVGAQNDEYAERYKALGVPPDRVRVTGNIKFAGVRTEGAEELRRAVREENGIPPNAPVLVFGSTRPGDEALAAACWKVLRDEFPELHLVVAPRHRDRLEDARAPFTEPILLRTEVQKGRRRAGERILFVDTLGELVAFYAAATVAVIGGSFHPGVNGHNPLESAALGVPTVFGPYMRNFIDPARVLVAAEGAVPLARPEDLLDTLRSLLRDPERRACIGARGREAVLANRDAIDRSLDLVDEVLSEARG